MPDKNIEINNSAEDKELDIIGARVHNLKNIDLKIPREKLVVITGLSGSGKSSLAFDTIYAEGQRRYLETFSAYARQFIGNMERPDIDRITGLSPVISIEQKTTSRNPRSTVGTVTEIYDFLRLLYARVADAYSYNTGKKMVQYTEDKIIKLILESYNDKKIVILSPIVKGRKGHYRDLFEQLRNQAYAKVRVDGEMREIEYNMKLDRYKTHTIELVVDRLHIKENVEKRLENSLKIAMDYSKGNVIVLDYETDEIKHFSKKLMCLDTGISYDEPEPNSFSFNSPFGACPECNGLSKIYEVNINKIIPDDKKTINQGGIEAVGPKANNWLYKQIEAISQDLDFSLDTPIKNLDEKAINAIMSGHNAKVLLKNEYLGTTHEMRINFEGLKEHILKRAANKTSRKERKWAENFTNLSICPVCEGSRLKKESNYFRIDSKNIAEAASMDLSDLLIWLDSIPEKLSKNKRIIAEEILREIKTRLKFLLDVGIDYLNLNRPARSLSGGEAQRIRLATQIGSQLTGVLYILDEPSIGLHQRDNKKMIDSLKELRDIGNSVIVVEHDEEMMRAADHIVDIGPGAGVMGGKIVANGDLETILKSNSITAEYLSGKRVIQAPQKMRKGSGKFLKLLGAKGNNLKNVDLSIPLGKLIVVTGVSGSGKSTLINETLYPVLSAHFYRSEKKPLEYDKIFGVENIDKVIDIDQSPIGRTPRSNPATYTGVFSEIRNLFALLPESKIRAYKPGRFSFNVKGGRCEACGGAGLKIIEMNFLPDVHIKCDECYGKRYNRETLEVRFKGKSINDVLNLTVNQAVEFFENVPKIRDKIKSLQDVGLGYITLGQQSTTLSGGEAQRVKLATELSKRDTGNTMYLLDEPTTGLHFYDIEVLMNVVNQLVDKGNTVIIIEHNPDVIKMADYIIDIGPEGGRAGGKIIAEGTPKQIIKADVGYTAKMLKELI